MTHIEGTHGEIAEEKALSEKGKTTITLPSGELIAFGFKIFRGEDIAHDLEREEKLIERFILGEITQMEFWKERKKIFGDLK